MYHKSMLVVTLLVALSLLLPVGSIGAQTGAGEGNAQPQSPSATVDFAVIGDYGGATSFEGQVATMVSGWGVDFVITTGDDYYTNAGGSGTGKYHNSTGQYYCDFIKDGGATGIGCATGGNATVNAFFPSMGNHDYSDATPAPSTYLSYFTLPGAGVTSSNTSGNERYYDFVQGPVHFFVLNSNSQEPDGISSTSTQANWLQTQLTASTSPWKVVYFHHAPYTTAATHGDTAVMQWPFDQWGVDVVFNGHDHIYERLKKNDVWYFVSGNGGWNLRPTDCGVRSTGATSYYCYDDNYGAMKVTATDTTMDLESWSISNAEAVMVDSLSLPQAPSSCTTVNLDAVSDTYIDRNPATSNFGTATPLIVDGDPNDDERAALIKWDVSGIPPANTINSASITLQVSNGSADGYPVYQLLRNWNEGQATWNIFSTGNNWQTAGAQGAIDRGATSLGSSPGSNSTGSESFALNASGLALIADWVDGSQSNYGVIMQDYAMTDSYQFDSREGTVPPRLTIEHCQPADMAGKAWVDSNSNGIQNVGEPGLANVQVKLIRSSDNVVIQTAVTDGSGGYTFSAVPTNSYYVQFMAPALYGITTKYATAATTPTGAVNDSDANQITGWTDVFAWTSGGTPLAGIDAGFTTSCVTVSLQEGVNSYTGMVDNWINQGSTGQNNGGDTTLDVTGGGTDNRALLNWPLTAVASGAKYVPAASIDLNVSNATNAFNYMYGMTQSWVETDPGGSDWNTYNNSTAWPGGAGVYPGSRGTTLLGYVYPTNNVTGNWSYPLNAAGRKQIETWIATSADNRGLLFWNENENDLLAFDSSENTTAANRPKLSFTHCNVPKVGNEVWSDLNANGVQDAGEASADGVTVELVYAGANNAIGGGDDVLVKTTQSVGSSSYYFDGLVNGASYYLVFIAPSGYDFSPQDVGSDATDSDVDPNTGYSPVFAYSGAQVDIDAGLIDGPLCYAISDSTDTLKNEASTDRLIRFDPLSGQATYIGAATGAQGDAVNLESATWDPFTAKLYSVEDIQSNSDAYLVTLNISTGAYTRVGGPLGQCELRLRNGTSGGNITASDVDGLGIEYTTGKMYATIRRGGPDALFQINPATGLIVPDAFPGGYECVEIEPPSGNTGLDDIDDIGFNPAGTLYGSANSGQSETRIVQINLTNGNTVDLGTVLFNGQSLTDIEGLGFDESGQAVASTGQDGDDGNDDAAFFLDLTSNPIVATRRVAQFNGYNVLVNSPSSPPYVSFEDYEGLTCYGVSNDAAPVVLSSIGNFIWVDENNDGYQDAGEDGVPNVLVELYTPGNDGIFGTADDLLARSTYTDPQGGYLFGSLPAGPYQVRIPTSNFAANAPLEGMTQTTNPVNSGDDFGNQTLVNNGNGTSGYTITLGFGQENVTADFGYNYQPNANVNGNTGPGAIGDRVWVDTDGDGRQDPEEIGIPGVTVNLLSPGLDGIYGTGDDPPAVVTTTDATGNYIFNGLPAGSYKVAIPTPPAGFTQTGDPDHFGTTGVNDNQTTTPIVLGPGDVFLNADFGYQPPANSTGSIGDHVWFDADGDGVDDGGANEYGIAGVTVALIRDVNNNGIWDVGEPIIATDTTDANGNYLFSGLPVTDGTGTDDYLVWVNDTNSVLSALEPTYDADGGSAIAATAPLGVNTNTVRGISRVSDLTTTPVLTQDFGYTPRPDNDVNTNGMIGDTIFFDIDGAGGQGANEPGIEGVVVELYDSSGTVLLGTTRTDENGHYYFNNLNANTVTYVVKVAASNFISGGVLQGLDNTFDPDGGLNSQSQLTLTPGAPINLVQDFGFRANTNPGSIGNLVWNDLNADGDVDAGENGINGVTVDLYRDLNGNGKVDPGEPLFATTVTAGGGAYSFTNLPTTDNGVGPAGSDWVVDVSDRNGVLAGYWHSLGTAGANNNSQIDPYAASISAGSPNNETADFGYYVEPAAVGNFVWQDLNNNGIQDGGEPGISGVRVEMDITYPDSTVVTLVTVTDGTGYYSFGNLLLDENYNGDGSGPEPSFVIKVPAVQPALTSLYPTAVGAGGSNQFNDSNNHAGTAAQPVQGQTNTSFANNNAVIASYDFGYRATPLAAILASFDAVGQTGHILVAWETVSELGNTGFNLYRNTTDVAPGELLASVASQAPGSAQGFSYAYQDYAVAAGQMYYYWLEAVDLNGSTSLSGPVSATMLTPTAVTLSSVEATNVAADSGATNLLWLVLVAAGLALVALYGLRRSLVR